jgi:hypothetical protein
MTVYMAIPLKNCVRFESIVEFLQLAVYWTIFANSQVYCGSMC